MPCKNQNYWNICLQQQQKKLAGVDYSRKMVNHTFDSNYDANDTVADHLRLYGDCISSACRAKGAKYLFVFLLSFPQNEKKCISFAQLVLSFKNWKVNTLPSKNIQTEQN